MAGSPLRKVLSYFETAQQGLSLNAIAREMQISPERAQGLVDFWVRKGLLRLETSQGGDCGACGKGDSCPSLIKLPRRYELVRQASTGISPASQCWEAPTGTGSD